MAETKTAPTPLGVYSRRLGKGARGQSQPDRSRMRLRYSSGDVSLQRFRNNIPRKDMERIANAAEIPGVPMNPSKPLELDDSTGKALATLILHLKDWSYDLFPEGDYSQDFERLRAELAEHELELFDE